MADKDGWVKLHRKLMESTVFHNPNLLKFWIWCLLKASYKTYKYRKNLQEVTLERGQFIFGRKQAALELDMTESTVYKYLKLIEKEQLIQVISNNKFSIVTVEKWAFYQEDSSVVKQQDSMNITTSRQQNSTDKNDKNEENVNNKKENDYNKKENGYIKKETDCINKVNDKNNTRIENNSYWDNETWRNTLNNYIEFRHQVNADMTKHAIELLINKLNKLDHTVQGQISILEQSIMNGWKSVYPISKSKEPKNNQDVQGKKSNSFHNFSQRTYDYDALELKFINKVNEI